MVIGELDALALRIGQRIQALGDLALLIELDDGLGDLVRGEFNVRGAVSGLALAT